MKPIAIVVPWFGPELKGGAEQFAWQIATRLAKRGHMVHVLTTCCRSFLDDWSTNHYRASKKIEGNLVIRRFKVDKRRSEQFNLVNNQILGLMQHELKPGVRPLSNEANNTFTNENINSEKLLNYLKRKHHQFKAFIFIPYLYGPILKGLPLVAEKAYLQPCLHDEAYAYLTAVENCFHLAKGILYNSEGEAHLAQQLYGPGIHLKGCVIGGGIEMNRRDTEDLPGSVKGFDLQQHKYILYLGRRDPTKNIDMLVQAYGRFIETNAPSELKLIMAGPGQKSYHQIHTGIIDFELVSEAEKAALLANCTALFQPSRNESYSRVLMEAWFYNRPVAAHRQCLSTAMAVERAGGGWLADGVDAWRDLFARVASAEESELRRLGLQGNAYAAEYADWDAVMQRCERFLGLTAPDPADNEGSGRRYGPRKLSEIHQSTPCLATGDAISNQVLMIQSYLRSLGYKSNIYVDSHDPSLSRFTKVVGLHSINRKAGLIYHHSIGSKLTRPAVEHPYPKCLVYHNITPAEFVKPFDPQFSTLLEEGRDNLKKLAGFFSVSVGDSAYNAAELEQIGFRAPSVLPICIDPAKWNSPADSDAMEALQDGKSNLLFVGRISPNKCQHHLVQAFYHYLSFDPEARLLLVGELLPGDAYGAFVLQTIEELGLRGRVLITGKVSDAQLQAYFRVSHLYWSMSEHEGFGVPLIEAMWFDIPVLAYKCTAVTETLGQAGILFSDKQDLAKVAALAKLCVHDDQLKVTILQAQQNRRLDFLPKVIFPIIDRLVQQLESQL